MAGFDSIIVLLGLLVIPALYLIYNQMIKKRRKAAIKFSNLMFVKSAISNKKKSKRDMWIFMISLVIIALMIIGFADPHIPLEQSKEGFTLQHVFFPTLCWNKFLKFICKQKSTHRIIIPYCIKRK